MGKTLNQMLENYLATFDVKIQKGPDSVSFTVNSAEGISRTSVYNILPYMHLIFMTSTPGYCREKLQKTLSFILYSLITALAEESSCF